MDNQLKDRESEDKMMRSRPVCQCCNDEIPMDEIVTRHGIQETDVCEWCYEQCDEHHFDHDADVAAKDDARRSDDE